LGLPGDGLLPYFDEFDVNNVEELKSLYDPLV
jgi:hypothetical protein